METVEPRAPSNIPTWARLLYVFLRHGAGGFVFDRPSWDQVRSWDTELREPRPWGYSLTGP